MTQPVTGDDIPRLERPAGFVPDWSAKAVADRRRMLAGFEKRWRGLQSASWPVAEQVDYRLIGSALARVRWELEIERGWQRNPLFYFDQTVGAVFDRLLQPPPFPEPRCDEIIRRMESIPATLDAARANLTEIRRPFAILAIESLNDIRLHMNTAVQALKPLLSGKAQAQMDAAGSRAVSALETYQSWLKDRLPTLRPDTAVGRDAYLFFLRNVALLPFTPEQLLENGRAELERSVSFETYEAARNRTLPQLALFSSQAAQMEREQQDESAVRRFLADRGILTVPQWVRHYRNLPLPRYLQAIEAGVTDDLTGPSRLQEDGTSYIGVPSPDLGYFALSTARDPRPILVHEGVPGHYLQLALSWANPDRIRRYYYDSGANEGIGFYAEEMMLQAGFFDDSPRAREIIYNFMRLRALRVEVDVKLALGEFTLEQAAKYLEQNVPMDPRTALGEAAMFASTPGQAISYQTGKSQILRFLARARRQKQDGFQLQAFHDFVWSNGNVPIALQQWQYLGDSSDVPALPR